MFSSLRSRLWLSYALVTAAALTIVAVVLIIYISQNPSTYRQASTRLTIVATFLRKNEVEWVNLSSAALQPRIEQVGNIYSTRILFYGVNRSLIIDSQSTTQPVLQMPRFPRLRPYSILRDQNGNYWLYMLRQLDDGRWILLAVPRPVVPLSAILNDELLVPILGAGLFALVTSLLVAFWLARWIADPLQDVVGASQQMPFLYTGPILPHGPQEVQELTRAFNKMNIRLDVSQKSQREFVANVSHELKTPLTSIQGFAQALLDGTANTPEAQKQAVQVITTESARMHRMVLDLLELTRLDSGILDFHRSPVDLTALLKSIAEKFTPQAQAGNVEIFLETTALPVIITDGDRLAQVFTNLMDNALKFTPAGGRITLRGNQVGAGVSVDVTDTGAGISSETLPYIFDRFYQVDPSRSGGLKHGAGLGLAIIKEIVGMLGGKISVLSKPGMGSSFTVNLPLTMPELRAIPPQQKM
jgi:signal transduction histidine kinase